MPPALAVSGSGAGIAPSEGFLSVNGDLGGPTLAVIENLTDVGSMTRLLHETIAREREIDTELEHLLTQRTDIEKKLLGLHKSAQVLELVRADSDQMLASVQSTCQLAEHVSGKVRELDLAQSHVQNTIARIEALVDRTSCIDGVKGALDTEDYEAAAKYVQTFLHLDAEFQMDGQGEATGARGGAGGQVESTLGQAETAREQKRQLLESKARLEEVIRRKFAEAAEAREQPAVERFAKLFAPLGLQEEGLRSYVAYLRRVVATRARGEYEALVESLDPATSASTSASFVDALTCLFRDIALAVENNEEILRGIYNEDGIVFAIRELQDECEAKGSALITKYAEVRKLSRLTKDVAAHRSSGAGGGGGGGGEGPTPREVEVLLEEMLMLCKRTEDYSSFMVTKLREAEGGGAQLSPRATDQFKVGALSRSVQEITSCYVLLDQFFMCETVHKAIRLDERQGDALTTSMVDDVFYILQTCARRSISMGNVQPVLASLNYINSVLLNEFREALQWKVKEPNLTARLFPGGGGGGVGGGGGGGGKIGADFAAALNNVDVSAEYVLKLKIEIEEHCAEVFPAPAEREKVKSCLNDLVDTSQSYRQLVTAGLTDLANGIVPRVRVLLDAIGSVSYELTEEQYGENEGNDPWVAKLCAGVDANVAWLQPLLSNNNYDSLVHVLIDFCVKRIEGFVTNKSFNQLGGLQLDRDARTLVGHFSGMTTRTVRDKFARLTQMATVLNLEKPGEILDYWGENSGPMTWRLTPAEVRRILGLRVDFKADVIAALRL